MGNPVTIHGMDNGQRVESRILEERIQRAVLQGARELVIEACGQHGLGGRLWISKEEPINVTITGSTGQRVGSMGFPNTHIDVMGPASDDVGWLNAGAEIVVHGNASNGIANAMAQGKVYVGGNIGSRGMTMTKRNPRFDPPELWILGSAGDYFAEFMAGGVAVVCGHNAQNPDNVLGYRPCVGMVGGSIFFRGPHKGFSTVDSAERPLTDEDWEWLTANMRTYLEAIGKPELYDSLTRREDWQLIKAKTPMEKKGNPRRSMAEFRQQVWEPGLQGGLIDDLVKIDRSPIPLIPTGELRRFVPLWENHKHIAPCEQSCPTGMPVQERWRLVRAGQTDEAMDLALAYTPFPATVCGYLCPNLCMQGCTRAQSNLQPIDIRVMGKVGVSTKTPELPELNGKRVAVIGGGPGGISAAWQLRLKGFDVVVYDMEEKLGGKIASAIPESRIPKEVVEAEIKRAQDVLPHVHLKQKLTADQFLQLKEEYDYLVLAIGAHKPRKIPVPGHERAVTALDFLEGAKKDEAKPGKSMVIIGAGNVGCDVATEAARLGAENITLIDIQKPAAFGKEKIDAEAAGAKFRWPCFTKEITEEGVVLQTGEVLPAETVVFSIGDAPDVEFLPETIATDRGHVTVNELYQTTDNKVFAIGDIVRPGLITNAIGAGRKAAEAIDDLASGRRPMQDTRTMVEYSRIKLEYFDPRIDDFNSLEQCAGECSSCGACRDCGLCEALCPAGAISRRQEPGKRYEYVSDPDKCIGCGFCAGACPCGVWEMTENAPMD
ncbi:FAD-dependent oxidoreductase [Oceanidesulfovibrio marinus]|uniref:Pyridine nucleotide-disulfide oxidoreductase n=1 Tax=Oceanidesulfovibrio marinus TaxID=370038 RepID=A0A6P1ZMU0_9BACT|nr:FAD-dependent oxidoreductase [Oceanidesulfovibrio marinus]TVM36604.1 pyridine nucleotide-disulfide oxidoreductase [Oceanidesulfovibrio marinus]